MLNEVSSKKSSSLPLSSKVQDFPKERGVTIDPPISKKPSEEKKSPKPNASQEEHKKDNLTKSNKKDKIKEVPIEEPKRSEKDQNPSPQFNPPPNMRMPNLSQDHMAKGMEELKNMTPESIAQMANTLKTMDPNLMQSIFKAQGIDMPPEQISKMAEMITPETINMMSKNFPRGGPSPSSGPSGPLNSQVPPFDPSNLDIASMLSNPEISKIASEMIAKQFGKKPEDIQIVIGCLGKCMSFISKVAKVYRFFTAGNRKYIFMSLLVLLIANYFGYLS